MEDFAPYRKLLKRAREIAKGMKTVAVLGIGGSSLGGQALTALRKTTIPFVEFHDNPDPFSWSAALSCWKAGRWVRRVSRRSV